MSVAVDKRGLYKFQAIFDAALRSGGGPGNPITEMFAQWAAIYATFIRRRFVDFSRGGGDWPDLADSTKAGRRGPGSRHARKVRILATANRKGVTLTKTEIRSKLLKSTARRKKKVAALAAAGNPVAERKFSILVDTGQLRDAILPGHYGNLLAYVPGGVEIGFSPAAHTGASMSMGDLAAIHHFGLGHNPTRTILVGPDARAERAMVHAAQGIGIKIERLIGGGA